MKRRYKPNLDGLPVGTRIRQAWKGHYRVGIIHETQTEPGGEYRVRPLNSFAHYPVKPKTIIGIEHLPGAPLPPPPWKASNVQPAPPPPASNDRPEPFYGFSSADAKAAFIQRLGRGDYDNDLVILLDLIKTRAELVEVQPSDS